MKRAFFTAVLLNVAIASGASAQSAEGKWKIDFGKWINEDHPNATMQFVPTGSLLVQVRGDSVIAMFTPDYPASVAAVQTPVQTDTLRGTISDGRVTLAGSRVVKTRRVQRTSEGEDMPSDDGDAGSERALMNMELVFTDGVGTGRMRMQAGEMAKFAAPMKLTRGA